jgi:peroxiredoxin
MAVPVTLSAMVAEGDAAPDFTAALANGEVEEFTLSDRFPDEAPLVLAFFPGSFTSVCSHEMSTFQERLGEFQDAGATLYGVSTDLPFSQNEFRDDLGLEFDLVSDSDGSIVDAYDVAMDFGHIGVKHVAKRAVFVLDGDRTVTSAWVSDDPSVEPDYDDVLEAVQSAA